MRNSENIPCTGIEVGSKTNYLRAGQVIPAQIMKIAIQWWKIPFLTRVGTGRRENQRHSMHRNPVDKTFQSGCTCSFPDTMTQSCEHFKRFWLLRHTGRHLTWQPSLGNADVRVSFGQLLLFRSPHAPIQMTMCTWRPCMFIWLPSTPDTGKEQIHTWVMD